MVMTSAERSRVWRKANPERHRANGKRWHKAHPEKQAARGKRWYETHRERILATRKRQNEQFQQEAIESYGGACVRCGTQEWRVLAFDHVNDDGAQMKRDGGHPSGRGFYRWLKKHDYPDIFQLLCHNCNHLKARHREFYDDRS